MSITRLGPNHVIHLHIQYIYIAVVANPNRGQLIINNNTITAMFDDVLLFCLRCFSGVPAWRLIILIM